MYDPSLGRWFVPDLLAEWNFNLTPYHYVRNNPILYIDPFGLQDTITVHKEIPEVVIVYVPSETQPSPPGFILMLYTFDQLLAGNYNPRKTRKATRFEEWCIRHFDMSEVLNIGKSVGHSATEGENNNTVRTDASYEGKGSKSDKEIVEENTGPSEKTTWSGEPIVSLKKRINKTGLDSTPFIWDMPEWYKGHNSYDKDGIAHGPFHNGDTVYWEYYLNGEKIDSFRHTK